MSEYHKPSHDDWQAENALAFVGVWTLFAVGVAVAAYWLWRGLHG